MKDLLIQQKASLERSLPMAEILLIKDSIRNNPQHQTSLSVRNPENAVVTFATCKYFVKGN